MQLGDRHVQAHACMHPADKVLWWPLQAPPHPAASASASRPDERAVSAHLMRLLTEVLSCAGRLGPGCFPHKLRPALPQLACAAAFAIYYPTQVGTGRERMCAHACMHACLLEHQHLRHGKADRISSPHAVCAQNLSSSAPMPSSSTEAFLVISPPCFTP